MMFPEILDLNRFSEVLENGELAEMAEAGAEKAAAEKAAAADDGKACAAATITADSGDEGERVAAGDLMQWVRIIGLMCCLGTLP